MFPGLPSIESLVFFCVNFVACITGRGTAAQRRRGRHPRAAAAPQQRASGAALWRLLAPALLHHRRLRSLRHSPRQTCRRAAPCGAGLELGVWDYATPPPAAQPASQRTLTCRLAASQCAVTRTPVFLYMACVKVMWSQQGSSTLLGTPGRALLCGRQPCIRRGIWYNSAGVLHLV